MSLVDYGPKPTGPTHPPKPPTPPPPPKVAAYYAFAAVATVVDCARAWGRVAVGVAELTAGVGSDVLSGQLAKARRARRDFGRRSS